jgi:hypothetical protein
MAAADPSGPAGRIARLAAWYERYAFPPAWQPPRQGPGRRPVLSGEFVTGVNLPWLNYGCDFGANAWRREGGVADPGLRAALREQLSRLRDRGVTLVRWFALCDARSGVREDTDGLPAGLDGSVLRDVDAACAELERAGMRAILVLLDFHLCRPERRHREVRMGGRRRWVTSTDARARLLDDVLRPLMEHAGHRPEVAAWDLFNEPEWVTRHCGTGAGLRGVPRRAMRQFLADAAALARGVSRAPVTVGLASAAGLELVREAGLDLYQVHWYDATDAAARLDTPVEAYRLDGPIVLGEYPLAGSARRPEEIEAVARRAGYAGALGWSALAGDAASGPRPDALRPV